MASMHFITILLLVLFLLVATYQAKNQGELDDRAITYRSKPWTPIQMKQEDRDKYLKKRMRFDESMSRDEKKKTQDPKKKVALKMRMPESMRRDKEQKTQDPQIINPPRMRFNESKA